MSVSTISRLTKNTHKHILDEYPLKTFKKDLTLVYKGQVPNVALLLVAGTVFVDDKEVHTEAANEVLLVGFNELVGRSAVSSGITILEGSKAIVFDRETALGMDLKT